MVFRRFNITTNLLVWSTIYTFRGRTGFTEVPTDFLTKGVKTKWLLQCVWYSFHRDNWEDNGMRFNISIVLVSKPTSLFRSDTHRCIGPLTVCFYDILPLSIKVSSPYNSLGNVGQRTCYCTSMERLGEERKKWKFLFISRNKTLYLILVEFSQWLGGSKVYVILQVLGMSYDILMCGWELSS